MLAPVFAQARSRLAAFASIGALLAEPGDRRSCWQLAERAGHAPRRMRAVLAGHAWDWAAALAGLQRFILARLGDRGAVVVLGETAELKKGDRTVGVARQRAGITGQVENCRTVVFAACVTARARTLFDFRLYLPKQWCEDKRRRERAHVPDDVEFAAKPALGTAMITAAADAGAPFGWVVAGEVYGRGGKLREACQKGTKGYVVAVPVNFTVTLPSGRKTAVAAAARLVRPPRGRPARAGAAARATATTRGPGPRPSRGGLGCCSAAAGPTLLTWRSSTAMPRRAGR